LQQTQPIAPPQDQRGAENNPQLGRIAIPSIGLDSELHQGIRLTTLDRGPGHWPGTAMPGQIGNVVVAGHRTSHGAEFRHLDSLDPGDEVVFTTADGTFTYSVTGTQIVTPDSMWIVEPTDTPTATLFACHPLGSTAKRIVVFLALST
ncbi:MAG TPA: class E sortase, partial [Ilumatobacteraceae bacterium]|nr:class E sortase [Ilumatobacteraceae bacterium]